MSNVVRGRAIKVLLLMELHRLISNNVKNLNLLNDIGPNINIMPQLTNKYLGNIQPRKCYICSDRLEDIIVELIGKVVDELSRFKLKTFVISVLKNSEMEKRELEIISEFKLDSWESIRREIKRELGKKVKTLVGLEPEFKHPDIVVMVDLDKLDVKAVITPTYILCRYLKLGRNISQVKWFTSDGVRKYPLAIEDVVEPLKRLFNAEDIRLHAAGREDVDARMLGNGRQLVVELRNAKNKTVSVDEVLKALSNSELILILFDRFVESGYVREIKLKNTLKVYRLLVLSEKPLTTDLLRSLEREFTNRVISQRTPTRVLRRRKDIVRFRRVYNVKSRLVNEYLIEFLVKCDGGLYVKELVHGDCGRTTPSFSEFLGCGLKVLELDVIDVISN
jgi:tRNA pseudouridine synthase 10